MTTDSPAFWIDHDHDRQAASDGVSRYGAYLRAHLGELAECWDGTWGDAQTTRVEFAAAAWRIATSPIMSPGYVQHHPRILAARIERNYWDCSLTGSVTLATPWPAPLARSRTWRDGTWWRDWPTHRLGEQSYFVDPTAEELAGASFLMASARLAFPVPFAGLPAAPAGPDDAVEETARAAVRVLVKALNRVITPVIETLQAA